MIIKGQFYMHEECVGPVIRDSDCGRLVGITQEMCPRARQKVIDWDVEPQKTSKHKRYIRAYSKVAVEMISCITCNC